VCQLPYRDGDEMLHLDPLRQGGTTDESQGVWISGNPKGFELMPVHVSGECLPVCAPKGHLSNMTKPCAELEG
jgi:hypothetical protein